jgi:hypothetical protein
MEVCDITEYVGCKLEMFWKDSIDHHHHHHHHHQQQQIINNSSSTNQLMREDFIILFGIPCLHL